MARVTTHILITVSDPTSKLSTFVTGTAFNNILVLWIIIRCVLFCKVKL